MKDMVHTANIRRGLVWQHVYAAAFSLSLAVLLLVIVTIDRNPPLHYVSTEIVPQPATAGQEITVRRTVVWSRQCEGEAWTEIVDANRVITFYDRGSRYPSHLGLSVADRHIALPKIMAPGMATYRGVIRFHSCGVTARWRSIDVPYQQVTFEVR